MDQCRNEEDSDKNEVAPPSYTDVVQSKMKEGTLAQLDPSDGKGTSFYREAPPSYLKLFGMTSTVVQSPRVTVVTAAGDRQNVSDSHQSPRIGNRHCGSLYVRAANRNRAITALYYCSFWIGLFLALAMLIAGCLTYKETAPPDSTDVSGSNIWIGSLLLFFVIWHTFALLCGVFAKGTGQYLEAYWCLRICHCGCYCWSYQFIPYSVTIWGSLLYGSIFPPSLVWFVVSCVAIQYFIILYCLFELVIDLRTTYVQSQLSDR